MSTATRQPAIESGATSSPAQTVPGPRERRILLIAVCIALMAVIAAVTGLNVAQPPLAVDLDASQSQVLWMINTYAITLAALLLPLGAVGDRWGRKPVLVAGLIVFGVANMASALAPSTPVMLAARFLSGVGAAAIMPVTLSLITSIFPESERSKAIGVWTGVAGGGGVIGMFLSAVLVDYLSWRWLFALPVVLVLIALVMTIRSVPDSRERPMHAFDLVGALLSIIAVMAWTFALHEGPVVGWSAIGTLSAAAFGAAASVAFVAWERRHPAPLLDVRLFRQRRLTSGSVSLLIWFGVQSGVFIVLYPFFQAVLGWSGLRATLGLMPMAVLMMGFSGVAPRLAARIGARMTMAGGILLGAIGLAMMALQVSVPGGYLSVLPGMIVMGIGMGLSMAPSTEAITRSLPNDRQGVASALNDVTREFGTALGVALLGAVFSAGYATAFAAPPGLSADAAAAAQRGIANAMEVANGAPYATALQSAARQAFVDGWQQAMWAGAAVMALLFVFVLLRGPAAIDETSEPAHAS
ncbi:MFS transporter [Lysobacter silvisoli]|uniref:MFS transporter n=1 Tax=Lysobacter silvisoli TaxID=2293254 RepID=A0A371K3N9_9GAMM|nr:MFS transporter [Lysobacter silvisoli]RDZ28539.1 MFS transporter [Lysobacter silvisoli]